MFLPKERYFLVLVVVLPLLAASANILLYLFPPHGYAYVGDRDEIMLFTSVFSLKNNFDSPWDNVKIFFTPMNGPPFFVMTFAFIASVLNMSPILLQAVLKYAFTLLILCAAYNIFALLIKDEIKRRLSFLLFLLYNGIGGIVFLLGRLATTPDKIFSLIPNIPVITDLPELGTAGGLYALNQTLTYHIVPLATGYLALLFFLKSQKYSAFISGVFLGLTFLFYPIFGIGSAVLIFIGFMTSLEKKTSKKLFLVYFIAAPFITPWIYSYLSSPVLFDVYRKTTAFVGSAQIHSLVISMSALLIFAAYGLLHRVNKKFVLYLLVPLFLFSLTRLITILHNSANPIITSITNSNASLKTLYSSVFLLEGIALIIVLKLVIDLIYSNIHNYKFFVVSLLVFFFVSVSSLNTARFVAFLIVPAAVLAADGILLFSERHRINYKKITAGILILTIPSIIIFTGMRFYYPQELSYPTYYTNSEYNALKFLEGFEQGRLLSSREIGTFAPFLANKKAMFAMYENQSQLDYNDRVKDYEIFFSDSNEDIKKDILKKYGIKYVFLGENEKKLSRNSSFMNLDFLERLHYCLEEAQIFRVR